MNLRPDELALVLATLTHHARSIAALQLLARIRREGFDLGAHVFQLELVLTSASKAGARPAIRERARMRIERGTGGVPLKALPKGVGPKVVYALHAPTMNEYNGLDKRQKEQLREATDAAILEAKTRWAWNMGVVRRTILERNKPKDVVEGGRRRVVVVNRFSSAPPDELSCDAIGGKIPIDRLVLADVLRGDTTEWLGRVPVWTMAPRERGLVRVDVYEWKELR